MDTIWENLATHHLSCLRMKELMHCLIKGMKVLFHTFLNSANAANRKRPQVIMHIHSIKSIIIGK